MPEKPFLCCLFPRGVEIRGYEDLAVVPLWAGDSGCLSREFLCLLAFQEMFDALKKVFDAFETA
jgi:hypothetical protein